MKTLSDKYVITGILERGDHDVVYCLMNRKDLIRTLHFNVRKPHGYKIGEKVSFKNI